MSMPARRFVSRRVVAPLLVVLAATVAASRRHSASAAEPPQLVTLLDDGTVQRRERPGVEIPSPLRTVPDELLVRFKRGVSRGARLRSLSFVPGARQREFRSVEGLHHLKLKGGVALSRAFETLRHDQSVEYVEPNYIVSLSSAPNDPSFPSQWSLANTGQTGGTAGADIGAVAAWDITTGSSDVVVVANGVLLIDGM